MTMAYYGYYEWIRYVYPSCLFQDGWSSNGSDGTTPMKEVFMTRMNKPALHVTLDDSIIEKVELFLKEVVIEDSLEKIR